LSVFKLLRIVVLLSILFVIVVGSWMTENRMASWERPILVTVYPIIADDDPATARFVRKFDRDSFDAINRFFEREARPYGFTVTPALRFQWAEPGRELPPAVPAQGERLAIALWSLKMRWWSWRQTAGDDLVTPDIQMFVLYHSLRGDNELGISVGMRKGRYGIVKAYAQRNLQASNHVVFTHELLHVLGATDKYVLSTGEPVHPDGFAEPDLSPLFPQQYAEIMGGRIPLGPNSSAMPESLKQCRIGRLTATEIGFYRQLAPGG
jgi:hypothetical protein